MYCFARSSKRLLEWFVGTNLYKKIWNLLCRNGG
ncbi:MAG: hypothetical protein SPF70_09910 [Lachnospiraceae bacterium]|nr:hypothetical protein [Lachnospiraceae bacterium]